MGLAIFAAVGVILLSPVITVVDGNTGTQSVENETVAVDFNKSVDLKGYQIDPGSETVYGYNETSGSYEQAASSDYTLHEDSGEIEFNSSSTLFDEGEEAKVSYTYEASDATTSLVVGFIPVGVALYIFVNVARGATSSL